MTREEAIKAFEEIKASAQNNLGAKYARGCEGYYQNRIELADAALEALRDSGGKLSEAKTCELVAELEKRDGVEMHTAEPYQDVTVSVNGPAVMLVVID